MAIQFKRGTTSNRTNYTPAAGELIVVDVDQVNPSIYVGDGSTAGGKLASAQGGGGGASEAFKTISVSGQDDVVAELEADNYGVKTISREDQGFGFAFPIATKFKSLLEFFGFTFASESYQPVLNWLQQQTKILSELNDPRGIYYHCFCSIE